MITKAKSLYQVKLILDYLPEEEYKLIPQETIDYIEDNFEYDETFTIDPSIPLEKQKIDDKAYDMLEKIVKQTKVNNSKKSSVKQNNDSEVKKYVKEVKESNENYEDKIEKIVKQTKANNSKKSSAKQNNDSEVKKYIKEVKASNENYENKIENIKLNNLIEVLKKENTKIPKTKALLEEYKEALRQKDNEIEKLKKNNQELYETIAKLPKIIRRLFIKDFNKKLLK